MVEACMGGACVAGGMHGRRTCMSGSVHGRGACVAGETATAADGTHPTGMHSCSLCHWKIFSQCLKIFPYVSLCFSCLEKVRTKSPVFPMPWPPCTVLKSAHVIFMRFLGGGGWMGCGCVGGAPHMHACMHMCMHTHHDVWWKWMPIVWKILTSQCNSAKMFTVLNELFAEHGILEEIWSDNRPQFASHLFAELYAQLKHKDPMQQLNVKG